MEAQRFMINVTYVRNKTGRHSRQRIAVKSRGHLRYSDVAMRKIGFVREGTQDELGFGEHPCVKCQGRATIHLGVESWCRGCVRLAFGGGE